MNAGHGAGTASGLTFPTGEWDAGTTSLILMIDGAQCDWDDPESSTHLRLEEERANKGPWGNECPKANLWN